MTFGEVRHTPQQSEMNPTRPASGIQWNKQALAVAFFLIAFLLYVFYTILPSMGSRYHDHSHKSWKTKHHEPIPQPIVDLQGKITVQEKEIEISMGDNMVINVKIISTTTVQADKVCIVRK